MAKFTTDLPSVCGHKGDRVVHYVDKYTDGRLNSICSPCFNKGIYFVQEVVGFDILLEGGHTITIQLPPD